MNELPQHIVFFDGVCNLCNHTVQYIIQHDEEKKFHFASLQSDFAQRVLSQYNVDLTQLDTIYYLQNGKLLQKSDAVIAIGSQLKSITKYLSLFQWIPTFVRDKIYLLISKNRYRLFGQKDQCMMPNQELQKRFLG